MDTSIRLPSESRSVELICMVDQWAWPPLAVRAASSIHNSEPFMILGMLCTILGAVHEQPLPHVLSVISSWAPALSPGPFSLIQAGAVVPFFIFILPANLAFLPENGP
jgi:hypothetical protein